MVQFTLVAYQQLWARDGTQSSAEVKVRQAAIRQKYIDQTQSLNLAFSPTDSPKWINQVHMEAWKLGVKTLYYLRTDSVIKGDLGSRMAECVSCDG